MYQKTILDNGLTVLTVPMTGTKTVTALAVVGTGSKYEEKRVSGVSHFLEHMFFKGTKKRPNTLAISAELDAIGSEFNAFTSREYTGYYVKAKTDKLETAMDVISDMLINSRFASKEIEREKGVIIEEFNMIMDNPIGFVEYLFEECLYKDTPAGRIIIGDKKSISNLTRKDLVDYVNRQYSSHNTFLILAGNFGSKNKGLALAGKYFSSPKFSHRGREFREKAPVVEKQEKPEIKVHYKDTDQAHIMLGVRSFDYTYANWRALKMLSIILGGSMSSRLFLNLRERNGLAYYVRTSAEFYTDSGYIATQAGVPVAKAEKAIGIILAEYKKLTRELVPAGELNRNKELFSGRVALRMESTDNMADWFGRQAVLAGTINRERTVKKSGIYSPEREVRKMRKVRPSAIRAEAKKIFRPERLNLAVIGPYKSKQKFSKLLVL